VLRWFGTNTDITEQRALQNALEETDRRKDEFLAMLAHELRNPVAPISNAAEVLARLVGEDKRCRPLVDMVHRQAVHLARLLDDLLDVARVTQGRIELRREVVSLATCIDQALETAQPLIREKAHRVTLTQMPSPLYVNVDKVRLAQCIANVLINAAKYTDDGGEIRIRPSVEGRLALVEVSDTGVGIAPDFLSRVFDLFAQSERALDRSQGGLGIGLAVCKQLIGMHGGTITASSAGLGHGATFTIRLPLVEAPHTVAAPEAAAALALHRILVVDDNADSADSLAMLLQMEGHETRTAYSAGMALELLAPFDPDVIILDIGLPDMDGYQLARQIRAGWKPVRLIALSGYGQVEDKQRSSAAGFDAHLVKPADAVVLRKVISPPGR
jgi:CheY-like chemotaxis protein